MTFSLMAAKVESPGANKGEVLGVVGQRRGIVGVLGILLLPVWSSENLLSMSDRHCKSNNNESVETEHTLNIYLHQRLGVALGFLWGVHPDHIRWGDVEVVLPGAWTEHRHLQKEQKSYAGKHE